MSKQIKLKDEWNLDIDSYEVKTADWSHDSVWLFSVSKVGNTQNSNMVVLSKEEANKLLEFLKEVL